MDDICEALTTLLQDVVLPEAKAVDEADESGRERVLKASVVKSAIQALLNRHQPETKGLLQAREP